MLKDGLTSEAVRSNLDLPQRVSEVPESVLRLSSEGVTCKHIPGDVTVSRDALWEIRLELGRIWSLAVQGPQDVELIRTRAELAKGMVGRLCGDLAQMEYIYWNRLNNGEAVRGYTKPAADPA
jgi:hypothetical protein